MAFCPPQRTARIARSAFSKKIRRSPARPWKAGFRGQFSGNNAIDIAEQGVRVWRGPPASAHDDAAQQTAFAAYVLLPGLSVAFLAASLGRSRRSIFAYRQRALRVSKTGPEIKTAIASTLGMMRAEHGLQMARDRGPAQLPFWSRQAIFEYRKRGYTRGEIATAFRCSTSTVANVLRGKGSGYAVFSGKRLLSHPQRYPPGCGCGLRTRERHDLPQIIE